VDETELRKLFDKYGSITDVYIRKKEDFSFAFISYSSINEANRAIEAMRKGQRINGK
jgi:RNA recognition motif-containing protein